MNSSPVVPVMEKTDFHSRSALLRGMDAYWRAANFLSAGQIYLCDNPLLKRPLASGDIKNMLLGHWGTTPGQNFIYVHLNRIIVERDLDMIYCLRPGPRRCGGGREYPPRRHL